MLCRVQRRSDQVGHRGVHHEELLLSISFPDEDVFYFLLFLQCSSLNHLLSDTLLIYKYSLFLFLLRKLFTLLK